MKSTIQAWPVDGHVHFHSLDAVGPSLNAAARNFRALRPQGDGLLGGLLLTQTSTERVFEDLTRIKTVAGWNIQAARAESETLIARRGPEVLAVVCGRQVRAADGLEVLALGTLSEFPDGLPFREALEAVRASGALTVIPWGFGKWLGERGRRVEQALGEVGSREVFMGDNGNRLSWARKPALLRIAQERGFRVLPGTDPFPFAGGYRCIGEFGFLANLRPDDSAPWCSLRAWLTARLDSPASYGRTASPFKFVFRQVAIQFYNKLPRGALK